MGAQGGFDLPKDMKRWEDRVLAFLRNAGPGAADNATVATYRFIQSLGYLPPEVADRLVGAERRHLIPAPETISRIVRSLVQHGKVRRSHQQARLHGELGEEVREQYRH